MTEALSVRNLVKYQHYKTRNPPWVKLHRNFWTDYKIQQLSGVEKLLFLGCLTLAAESENQIPNDTAYLSKRLGFPVTKAMVDHLLSLTLLCLFSSLLSSEYGLASKVLAPCKQVASRVLADKTSKGLSSIGSEVGKIADKHFPPIT